MKKFLLPLLLILALPVLAQRNETEYRVNRIYSTSGEEILYTYESENSTKPICQKRTYESPYYTYVSLDSLFYDNLGQLVKVVYYSLFDNEIEYSYHIEYTYNDNGQIIQGDSYFYDELEYIVTYTYDENNLMTSVEATSTYDDEEYSEKMEFSYNDEGLRIKDVYTINEGFGDIVEDIVRYDYENGLMVREEWYYYEDGEEYLDDVYIYEYDEHGNCIMEKECDEDGTVEWKKEYHHDINISNDIVHYYNDLEEYMYIYPSHNNMIIGYTEYQLGDNGEYIVSDECEYSYDEINVASVVENNIAYNIYPNPVKDIINIEAENIELVEIYDVFGRKLYSEKKTGDVRIDMSDFSEGIYFVKIFADGSSSISKIVKNIH